MTAPRAAVVLILTILLLLGSRPGIREAHQDPCHRRHSCPSDHGTYVCGDLGRCDQCPDNQYCLAGKPRAAAQPVPQGPPPLHSAWWKASASAWNMTSNAWTSMANPRLCVLGR